MSTYIAQFQVFEELTSREHRTIVGGWINGVEPEQIAYELQLPILCVKAYYGVKDLMLYEAECRIDDVLHNGE